MAAIPTTRIYGIEAHVNISKTPMVAIARREVLMANGPGEAVGILTGFNMAYHFHRMHIDNRNITVRSACHKCARAIGLHLDAGCAVSDWDSPNRFSSCGIDDG